MLVLVATREDRIGEGRCLSTGKALDLFRCGINGRQYRGAG